MFSQPFVQLHPVLRLESGLPGSSGVTATSVVAEEFRHVKELARKPLDTTLTVLEKLFRSKVVIVGVALTAVKYVRWEH